MQPACPPCYKLFHDAVQSQHDWTNTERKNGFKKVMTNVSVLRENLTEKVPVDEFLNTFFS